MNSVHILCHYALGAKTQSGRFSSKISTLICDNFETVRDRMSVSRLVITNMKSHTGFRLVQTSVTLNDLKRRNNPYFALFHRILELWGPITSQCLKTDLTYTVCRISSSTFGQN